jgi:hypothetical protein
MPENAPVEGSMETPVPAIPERDHVTEPVVFTEIDVKFIGVPGPRMVKLLFRRFALDMLPLTPFDPVALMLKLNVPEIEGVPDKVAVAALKVSPGSSVPADEKL